MTLVSLVCTLLNEASSVEGLLNSVAAQTLVPAEMIIVDGGSRDGTQEAIVRWSVHHPELPLRLIDAPGVNISQGRNQAIGAARHELVAITDGGVRLASDWLEHLLSALPRSSGLAAVSGFFVPDPRSAFELALGATTLPDAGEIRPESFLPSSRSLLMTRGAWRAAGGYPEWLDYCEDLVLDLNLRRAGVRLGWAPRAVARFRPRTTPRSYVLQYFRYARGDGKADLWFRRHLARYVAYLAAPLLLFCAPLRIVLALLVFAGAFYLRRPYLRLIARRGRATTGDLVLAAVEIPILRLVGDAAKMAGYPVGWLWRHRHAPPEWRLGGR